MRNWFNYGLYVCIFLFCFSFLINLIHNFDCLKEINQEEEITTFYELIDFNVKTEKFKKEKLIYKYVVYFIFFINIDHFEEILNY